MLVAIVPVEGYVLYYNITLGLPWRPYSWDNLHSPEWYKIIKVPAYGQVFFDRWSPIGSGFLIFVFFGFGRDATRIYRRLARFLGLGYCFSSVAGPTDFQDTTPSVNASSSTTLVGSISSRAKLMFKGHKASAVR
jgi:pheromone a factor receptor